MAMSQLRYETFQARREGLTRDLPAGDNENLRWVANSATLISGDHDAVLVDTFTTIEQNERLIEWVRARGCNLTQIYLTHGHGDHIFGIGQLLKAFPGAQAVATAGTVARARLQVSDEQRDGFWGRLFPGQIPPPAVPAELDGDTIKVEEHELRAIEAGHTDTTGTTVLWCPALRLIMAGDVVYSHTHMYLAETTTTSRQEWIESLVRLKDLDPLHVVAGHKQPGHKQPGRDDDPADIDESIRYLTDFNKAQAQATTATELYEDVLRKHAGRANPGSLWGAAKLFKPAQVKPASPYGEGGTRR
jgi:glyoxylase-like metal-dependent hydrolase (beta-lactamase superfamily II)